MQKRQARVLPDLGFLGRVDEVPRGADVRVWDGVEGVVEGREGGEGEGVVGGGVGGVDGFVGGAGGGGDVPGEVVAEAAAGGGGGGRGGGGRGGERGGGAGEGGVRGYEVGFGGGDEPVGEGAGDVGVFLFSSSITLLSENLHELDAACWGRKGMVWWEDRTPLTRSKIIRIATQNSSKSRFPSLSTSARSHTRSSWSSRSWLFFSTEAACAPERWVPPLASEAKISQ